MSKKKIEDQSGSEVAENENATPIEQTPEAEGVHEKEAVKHTRPKGKFLASGGDFHKFTEQDNVFVGAYLGRTMVREKAGKEENQKAGDIMGYYFATADGEQAAIGNSYSIAKAVAQIKEGDVLYIEFLGQKTVGAKKVNQFDVILLDTEEERNKYGF